MVTKRRRCFCGSIANIGQVSGFLRLTTGFSALSAFGFVSVVAVSSAGSTTTFVVSRDASSAIMVSSDVVALATATSAGAESPNTGSLRVAN